MGQHLSSAQRLIAATQAAQPGEQRRPDRFASMVIQLREADTGCYADAPHPSMRYRATRRAGASAPSPAADEDTAHTV
jgi:hypothetical protein